jgi:genome maintenance exonuclease 1
MFTSPILNLNKFDYKKCVQVNTPNGRHYVTPDGENLKSVTTILDATSNKDHLVAWKARLGESKANQVTKEAAGVGTALHANLERFIKGEQRQPGNNFVHIIANKMADQIIANGLVKVSEVWAIEQSYIIPDYIPVQLI